MHLFFMQVKVRFSNSRFNFLGVFWEPISRAGEGQALVAGAASEERAAHGSTIRRGGMLHGCELVHMVQQEQDVCEFETRHR